MVALNLDGVRFFRSEVEGLKYNGPGVKKDILLRMTAIVRAVLLLVAVVVRQLCRAIALFASGHLKESGRDVASVVVQCVALPLLGITAMFSTPKAEEYSRTLIDKFNATRSIPRMSKTRAKVFRAVGGTLALPVYLSNGVCGELRKLLAGDVRALKPTEATINVTNGIMFTATLGMLAVFHGNGPRIINNIYFYAFSLPSF